MKKEICLFVFLVCMLVGVGNALTNTCSSNDAIFSIYDYGNAHGELGNLSSYGYKICYGQIFNKSAPANPRECIGSNEVISLSSTTNAHGAEKGSYLTKICYGDLVCNVREGMCNLGEKGVASLSSRTNAHLGVYGVYGGSGVAGLKVCCLSQSIDATDFAGKAIIDSDSDGIGDAQDNCPTARNPIQEDSDGDGIGDCCDMDLDNDGIINSIDSLPGIKSCEIGSISPKYCPSVSNKIKISYDCGDRAVGSEVSCKIVEKTGLDEDIKTLGGTCSSVGTRKIAELVWTIESSDLANANGDYKEFYVVCGGNEIGPFCVNPVFVNTPPRAIIQQPVSGGVYFAGVEINFSHISIDAEGPLTAEWTISDNSISAGNKNKDSFMQNFNTPGQRTIKLKVTDSNGATSESEASILIIDSKGVYAFIDKPKYKQIIINNLLAVNYSANSSYAVNASSCDVRCLAGNCPEKTMNSLVGCGGGQLNIGGNRGDFSKLYFEWTFKEGSSENKRRGLGIVNGVYGFSSVGARQIDLILNYTEGAGYGFGVFSRVFEIYDSRQCTSNGAYWIDVDNEGNEIKRYETANSIRCAGKNQVAGDGDDCCPSGWTCSDNPNTAGCRFINGETGEEIDFQCEDYEEEEDCTDDIHAAARESVLWKIRGCGTTIGSTNQICKCVWEDEKCVFGKTTRSVFNPDVIESECFYSVDSGVCENGYQEFDIGATGDLSEECKDSKETIPCGNPNVQLPFFGWINFVLGLVLVLVLYCLRRYGKKS